MRNKIQVTNYQLYDKNFTFLKIYQYCRCIRPFLALRVSEKCSFYCATHIRLPLCHSVGIKQGFRLAQTLVYT